MKLRLVARHELVDRRDSLLRGRRIAAHELHFSPEQSALGVALVHGELVAARELVAVERQGSAVGIDGADAQGVLRDRGTGRQAEQRDAREGAPHTAVDVHCNLLL